MKLTREEFRKYIFSYNEDEAFYKKLYLQKKKDTAALLPFSGRTVLSVPYVCAMVATSLYVSFLILT